jgi:hypothetical protein
MRANSALTSEVEIKSLRVSQPIDPSRPDQSNEKLIVDRTGNESKAEFVVREPNEIQILPDKKTTVIF